MLDLTIVGGGIQGTAIARALVVAKAVSPERLAILDPHEEPLALWRRQSAACGMAFLRSPSSHNLDVDFRALRAFALRRGYDPADHYRPPYRRPSLELFNAHSRFIADTPELRQARVTGRLMGLSPGTGSSQSGWQLETDRGVLESRMVLLALGKTEAPFYPSWATGVPGIDHVFSSAFRRPADYTGAGRITIVGGGITAGQLAVSLGRELSSDAPVLMVTGRPLEVHQFDSEPCYLGPRCLQSFVKIRDPEERRRIIREARYPGSIPPSINLALRQLKDEGRVTVIPEWAVSATRGPEGVALETDAGRRIESDRVILATGFRAAPPEESIVASVATEAGLPRTDDGFPVPDPTLQWAPGLFLTGALGETEIGPGAPNIIGAQLAVRRLLPFLRSEPAVAWRPVRLAVP